MNTQVKKIENSQIEVTVEVGQEVIKGAINKAFNMMKKDFNIPGFRKGKVTRAVVEKMYGVEIFFNKAADIIIDETLEAAVKENNIEMAARLREGELNITEFTTEKMIYVAKVTVKPEVTLGDYKNLEVEVDKPNVTEEEILEELNGEAKKNAREISVVDRAVMPQDKVVIDFVGYVDGEAFPGGEGQGFELVIGSKSFIDNFEDQLIGKNIGEEVEVNVTFPEEYHAPELAGKPAMFKVTIKEIKSEELPEINDDFAADISEFTTLAEYKDSIKAKLQTQKETAAKNEVENQAIQKAIDNATLEIPAAMIEDQTDRSVRDFEMRMKQQGLEIGQYLQYTGQNMDAFRENFKKDAEFQLRSRAVLEKVVEVEGITATEEAVQEELQKLAERYKMELEELKKSFGAYERTMLEADLKVQQAAKLIVDSAKVTEK
ncbi:MAG: trigger factor [Cellulosilyticaceae bacterium]